MNVIRLILNELRRALRKHRNNRQLILQLSDYLAPGKYLNTPSFDCIYNIKRKNNLGRLTFFSHDRQTALSEGVILLFNRLVTYSVSNSSKSFLGTEVIISSSLTEYKIFDFEKKRVLTIYQSLEKLNGIQENKSKFQDIIPIPVTITVNNKQLYTIEELIPHQEFSINEAFLFLCDKVGLVLKAKYVKTDVNAGEYRKACDLFAKRFGNSNLLYSLFGDIQCITHGDLWSSNIIYDGETYYITDFERVGERYFLFDIFTFMFTEWLLKGDSLLLDAFFSGDYDKQFDKLFQFVNVIYNGDRKQEYFLVFLVSITFERWQNYFGVDRRINELIKQYLTSF